MLGWHDARMQATSPQIIDTIRVNKQKISCDGGAEGHPRVYLHLEHETGEVICPYCSRRFVREGVVDVGH